MKMKKNDWILILVILCVAGVSLILYKKFGQMGAGQVVIKVDGEIERTYNLSETVEVHIGETNVLRIADGEVKMIQANCPDQICVNHKSISKNKESIICLPNKVIVEITSKSEAGMDMIAN